MSEVTRRGFFGLMGAAIALVAHVPRLGGEDSKPLRAGSIPAATAKSGWYDPRTGDHSLCDEHLCGGRFRSWWDHQKRAVRSTWRRDSNHQIYSIYVRFENGGEEFISSVLKDLRECARFTAHGGNKASLVACLRGHCQK